MAADSLDQGKAKLIQPTRKKHEKAGKNLENRRKELV
jgi:hypothetical protein